MNSVQQITPNGNSSDRLVCQYSEMNILERKPIFYLKWSVYNDKAKSDFFRIKQYSSQPLPQNDQKIPTPKKSGENQANNQQNQVPAQILQIEVEHEFIYDEIKRLYTSGELNYIKDGTKVEFQSRNIIKVTTKSENSIEIQKCFGEILQNLEKNLYESTCEMSEIVKNHIQQQMKSELRQFQDLFKINFKFEKIHLKPQPQVSLQFGLQKITLIQGNISMLECEAIANISTSKVQLNNTQNTDEIDYSICAMAGTEYIQVHNEYVLEQKILKNDDAFIYELKNGRHIHYIITFTPFNKDGLTNVQKLERNLKIIFAEAQKLKITNLAIPIFRLECGYEENAAIFLNSVINLFFSAQFTFTSLYIVESKRSRFIEVKEILMKLLKPKKKAKYQWQWFDGQKFQDYDDEDINLLIDEGYEKFQSSKQETKIDLKFPYCKIPGTHTVDLENGTITNISSKQQISISEKNGKFIINNIDVDQQLNEYLQLQKQMQIKQFQIFAKQISIVFTDTEYYQLNQKTQYKRIIQKVEYKKFNPSYLINIIQGKKFDILEDENNKFIISQNINYKMISQSFDAKINELILQRINDRVTSALIKVELNIPNVSIQDLKSLNDLLCQESVRIIGKVQQGESITIEIFQNQKNQFEQQIETLLWNSKKYPIEWSQQNENCKKVLLSKSSPDYIKIAKLFQQTDKGQIHQIYRIQNQSLWDNYIIERDRLKGIHKQQGTQLTQIEEERYLWHGVKKSHPSIIYSGLKEAFDQTYSAIGMWGPGIYFAENASYSREYSYKLTASDDKDNAGKLVFLCCLITTGKVEVKQADKSIKRPSTGYDCVSGFTNGSNVFILYSMDIRRAYPAYEIIYT